MFSDIVSDIFFDNSPFCFPNSSKNSGSFVAAKSRLKSYNSLRDNVFNTPGKRSSTAAPAAFPCKDALLIKSSLKAPHIILIRLS